MFIISLLLVAQAIVTVVMQGTSSAMLDFLIFCTCCGIGDVLIHFAPEKGRLRDKRFLAGIMCHAIGQISLFGMLFVNVGLNVLMLVFPVIACVILYFVSKSIAFDFEKLFTFVWTYALLISANFAQCVWLTVQTGHVLPAIGGALIWAAALLQMFWYFYEKPGNGIHICSLLTYYLGMEALILAIPSLLQ